MDEKLKATIQKIKVLAAQNPEFESEMKKIFGSKEVCTVDNTQNETRIKRIEKYLGLDYYVDDMNPVIDYSFIQDPEVKAQLVSDCREMMRFRYGTRFHEIIFEEFCRYAQLQAEMLLNYFYVQKDNNDLTLIKQHINRYNSFDISESKSLSAISFNVKLWAFSSEIQESSIFSVFNNVREVRNGQSHRSMENEGFNFETFKNELLKMRIPLFGNGYVNTNELKNNVVLKNIFDTKIKNSEAYKKYNFCIWLNNKPYDSVIDTLKTLLNAIVKQLN